MGRARVPWQQAEASSAEMLASGFGQARKEDLKEFREYSVRKIWNETGTVGC